MRVGIEKTMAIPGTELQILHYLPKQHILKGQCACVNRAWLEAHAQPALYRHWDELSLAADFDFCPTDDGSFKADMSLKHLALHCGATSWRRSAASSVVSVRISGEYPCALFELLLQRCHWLRRIRFPAARVLTLEIDDEEADIAMYSTDEEPDSAESDSSAGPRRPQTGPGSRCERANHRFGYRMGLAFSSFYAGVDDLRIKGIVNQERLPLRDFVGSFDSLRAFHYEHAWRERAWRSPWPVLSCLPMRTCREIRRLGDVCIAEATDILKKKKKVLPRLEHLNVVAEHLSVRQLLALFAVLPRTVTDLGLAWSNWPDGFGFWPALDALPSSVERIFLWAGDLGLHPLPGGGDALQGINDRNLHLQLLFATFGFVTPQEMYATFAVNPEAQLRDGLKTILHGNCQVHIRRDALGPWQRPLGSGGAADGLP